MALIDLILNVAALMLWWNWLALHFDPLVKSGTVSLVGTLRKADPAGPKRWRSLVALVLLLLLRAIAYRQLSPELHWTPTLSLEIINLPFRSDYFWRMLFFSFLSFVIALGVFYLWVLFLSVVNAAVPDTDPVQKFVRVHFKWLESWPIFAKLLLPFVVGAVLWFVLHPLLAHMSIVPRSRSIEQVLEQSAFIGAATYLGCKYLIVGILLLHLLNSYVYLGNHAFWNFINVTARNILWPLRWLPLRVGKVDFLPLLGIALVFFATELVTNPPERLAWFKFRQWFYRELPF